MSLSQAQAAANELRTALLDNGVRQVSIELQPGVAGSGWGVAPFKRVLGHHIASYPPGTPGLGLVKKGRTGANALTGPLANCYGGFDLIARIITLGWANHPGAGGPWPVPSWGTVPKDNGRPYVLGWEFEGGYLPYTDEMHDFMARCGAGSLDWLGTLPGNPGPAPLECFNEHKGWAGPRKPDRIGYTTASGRARIATARNSTLTPPAPQVQEDEQMIAYSTVDTKRGYLQQGLDFWWEGDGETYDTCKQAAGGVVIQINQRQADVLSAALGQRRAALVGDIAKLASGGTVDVEKLAAAVAAKVPAGGEVTAEQMKDAAKAGLVDVLTSGTGA